MKKRGTIGSFLSRLTTGSRIWSRFFSGDSRYTLKNKHSLKENEMLDQSFFGHLYGMFRKGASALRRVFAAYGENSRTVKLLTAFCRGLLDTSVGSVGVFLFFTGLYSAASFLINAYAGNKGNLFEIVSAGVIVLVGLILMPVRRSILGCVRQGVLTSYFAEEVLAISPYALDTENAGKKHFGWAVLLGTLAGLLGFFLSPVTVLSALLVAALSAVIIYSPEGGLYIAVFLLPFASPLVSAAAVLVSGSSYLIKLAVGKRNFFLSTADIFVFLFAAAVGIAGVVTPFNMKNFGITVLTVAVVYILCVNLMRNGKQIYRLFSALSSGVLILAMCCIFAYVFPDELGSFGEFIVSRSQLAHLLPVLLPACICTAFCRGVFSTGTFTCIAVYTAVALSFSEWMYIAAICVTTVYFMCAFRKKMGTFIGGAVSCAAVLLLFGMGIIPGTVYSGAVADKASVSAAFKYALSGIGFGENALEFAYKTAGYESGSADIYASIVIGGGIMLLFLFCVALFLLLRRGLSVMWGKRPLLFRHPSAAAFSLVGVLLVYGFFCGSVEAEICIALFAVVGGCLSSLPRIYEREAGEENEIE